MPFTISNQTNETVITKAYAMPLNALSVTGGTFPIYSGDTISGNNSIIINGYDDPGTPYGEVGLFLTDGGAKITVSVNSSIYSEDLYGSGWAVLQTPIILSGDSLDIVIEDFVIPSPTPSSTASVTPTPTPSSTPSVTPTPTSTTTPTPSPS